MNDINIVGYFWMDSLFNDCEIILYIMHREISTKFSIRGISLILLILRDLIRFRLVLGLISTFLKHKKTKICQKHLLAT